MRRYKCHLTEVFREFLVLLLITSCQFINDDIKEEDLVGVWVMNREDCENKQSDCPWFEFTDDGHFVAMNLPDEYFGYFIPTPNATFEASGTWKIELSSDPLGNDKIRIRFNPVTDMNYPIYNTTIYVEGKRGDFNLFEWHGDPSNRITFKKLSEEN